MTSKEKDELSAEETVRRRDDAIRRALNTPRKPNNEYVGKSERAKSQRGRARLERVDPGQKTTQPLKFALALITRHEVVYKLAACRRRP